MMIYFNEKKDAFAYEIKNPIASIDMDTWKKYSNSKLGEGYDIINGVFTPLQDPESIQSMNESKMREAERKERYMDSDDQISKCDNYILLNIEVEKYTALKRSWLLYKMAVRETQNSPTYPYNIIYPDKPTEVE